MQLDCNLASLNFFYMPRFFPFLLSLLCFTSCSVSHGVKNATPTTPGDYRVAFYNVENLFDTIDDPANPGDDEFLPTSKKNWTPERYQKKLDHLARVVEGMGYPALLGVAEVENEAVLVDFCKKTSLKAHVYDVVHFESPDFRGIDVALLFKKSMFKVTDSETIRIKFPVGMIPGKPDYTTRDLLVVEGVFAGKEKLHVIVGHLPSRSEGQKETEPRRKHVASQIAKKVGEILDKNPKANIIVMGDMNDEPTDPSMAQSLDAQPLGDDIASGKLYNCFTNLQKMGEGSYRYRGDWNMLDQIIVSGNLVRGGKQLNYASSTIFQADWMMYKDEKYGISPSRTFGGDRYFGGYSDHLPVFVDLK